MKRIGFLGMFCLMLMACQTNDVFQWNKQSDGYILRTGDVDLGMLNIPQVKGIDVLTNIDELDSTTFKITAQFTAKKAINDARLQVHFTHFSKSSFWMIPSVSYNGNHWGRGKEPKGADENGVWRTISYRRTPIPGAMYSEGEQFAVATWSDVPQQEKEDFAISIQPEENQTKHCYIWPEEEMPTMYASRDRFVEGTQNTYSLKKGEQVVLSIYVHVTPVQKEHAGIQSFLKKAWELADKEPANIYAPEKLWELGIRYAKESLWAEEGSYKGFSIGLNLTDNGTWKQRSGNKYEIGWCGQNASYAISLLHDYLKNGNQESLQKGMATLDTWSKCALSNGLFVVQYDDLLYRRDSAIDACNLGTAAINFFEAYDVAKQCGFDRPAYENLAYGICNFVMNDQQENGCYAKGWKKNGECLYRDGTIGCFIVPAMIEAYRRSQNEVYLNSAKKAYQFYLSELKEKGFTTAGALDTWCIDKESSIALLRSAMRFYKLTNDKAYINDAVAISYYLSTWLWHYNEVYPQGDNFTEYDYHTFGGTSVSVQHNHLDPYAMYWIPEWIELAEITGDQQWQEKAIAIWQNGNQLVSDGTLTINGHTRPAGSQNEAYFESRWGFPSKGEFRRINDWLVAWPGAFRLETIRRLSDRLSILDRRDAPQAKISNENIQATFYLPDNQKGYYRATRFDWSGFIKELTYKGHTYFSEWNKDYAIYSPFSHIIGSGPVNEYSPIGYEEAKIGQGFLKLGVGILEKPEEKAHERFKQYKILDHGEWNIETTSNSITYTQKINNYGFICTYTKKFTLSENALNIQYAITNEDTEAFLSDVYNHHFLTLDRRPVRPSWRLHFPFTPKGDINVGKDIAKLSGHEVKFLRGIQAGESVWMSTMQGFDPAQEGFGFTMEERTSKIGVNMTGDHALSNMVFWAAPYTVCPETYIDIHVAPGETFTWENNYEFYEMK